MCVCRSKHVQKSEAEIRIKAYQKILEYTKRLGYDGYDS